MALLRQRESVLNHSSSACKPHEKGDCERAHRVARPENRAQYPVPSSNQPTKWDKASHAAPIVLKKAPALCRGFLVPLTEYLPEQPLLIGVPFFLDQLHT
ncbi:MAG TPA: hypothetical protein VK187_10045, partial [Geobacteraceae bacterium]|nr:hypothetical protein [Geobacteraceae bacterium]